MAELRLTGNQYSTLICQYVCDNFGDRGISVYTQIVLGKSIIGKDRTVDALIVEDATRIGFVLEAKYQASQGTVDEKIPYTLEDLRAMRTPGCVVYAGEGFSSGILHMLRASDLAAYCMPDETLARTPMTRELDHVLAQRFGWWDLIVKDSRRFVRSVPA